MRIRKLSEVLGLKVYTDAGDFIGEIEEANLQDNKVYGWRVRVSGSIVSVIGARGVIIPQQFVRAVGDIFIVSKAALPSTADSNLEELPEDLL